MSEDERVAIYIPFDVIANDYPNISNWLPWYIMIMLFDKVWIAKCSTRWHDYHDMPWIAIIFAIHNVVFFYRKRSMKIYENCIRCSTHSQTVTMYGNQPRSAVAMPWRSWPSASRRSSTWACQSRTKSVGCEAEKKWNSAFVHQQKWRGSCFKKKCLKSYVSIFCWV